MVTILEQLVTILEHQDEAEGNKDMKKALILKAKQMKMRHCAIPCAKTIPKSDQTSTFSTFRARKSFERNGATFAGELTRSFSLRRAYTYVLSISTPKTSSRPYVG